MGYLSYKDIQIKSANMFSMYLPQNLSENMQKYGSLWCFQGVVSRENVPGFYDV